MGSVVGHSGSNGEEKKDGYDDYQDMSITEIIEKCRNVRHEEIQRELEEMKRLGLNFSSFFFLKYALILNVLGFFCFVLFLQLH